MVTRTKTFQYTIRGIPALLDRALRARAKKENKSLNEVALEALKSTVNEPVVRRRTSLRKYVGTWVEDPEFDKAMEEQRQIDQDLWK